MSTFPDGLYQHGGVPVGSGGNFRGWWDRTTYFVDNDSGSDSNTGKKPGSAFLNLKAALDVMEHDDVVYIKPCGITTASTGSNAIPDGDTIKPATAVNWATTVTQVGISIVGAGSTSHLSNESAQYRVYLKGHASVTTGPVLDILGAMTNLENLAFHRGGVTSVAVVRFKDDSAYGGVVSNCLFRWGVGAFPTLHFNDTWYPTVENSIFYACERGVVIDGINTNVVNPTISNCRFRGPADSRDVDIYITGCSAGGDTTPEADVYIHNCNFGILPAHSGGSFAAYIYALDGHGLIAGCRFQTDDVQYGTTAGKEIACPTTLVVAGNWDGHVTNRVA